MKDQEVDSIVQDFVADELSSLDKIGSNAKSLQLSPKYERAPPPPANNPATRQVPTTSRPYASNERDNGNLENPKRKSSSSLLNTVRKSSTPSESSIDSPAKQSFGDKFKNLRGRIGSSSKK